jgi:hypothetical protein
MNATLAINVLNFMVSLFENPTHASVEAAALTVFKSYHAGLRLTVTLPQRLKTFRTKWLTKRPNQSPPDMPIAAAIRTSAVLAADEPIGRSSPYRGCPTRSRRAQPWPGRELPNRGSQDRPQLRDQIS